MADNPPVIGETAEHPNGGVLTYTARGWVQTTPPRAPMGRGRVALGAGAPREEAVELRNLRSEGQAGRELERSVQRVRGANERLRSGPWRGTFLDAAIPSEDDSWLGSIGGITLGPVARMTGAITDQNVADYQSVGRARNEGVLAQQRTQRGVQTESDAARMALAGINVRNTPESNETVIGQATNDAQMLQGRAAYFNEWASRYGSISGTRNSRGQTVEQAWNQFGPAYTRRMMGQRPGTRPRGGRTARGIGWRIVE